MRGAASDRRGGRRCPGMTPFAGVVAAALLWPVASAADGTPPCTDIVNQAVATYTVDSNDFTQHSNIAATTVAQLTDVNVVWQDASHVTVCPGDSSRVLTFLLTNTGNGPDSYTLSGQSALSGDDFDPVFVDIYLDANGSGVFEPELDVMYVEPFGNPTLAADESMVVFVLNNIPGGAVTGNTGRSELIAASDLGTGESGTVFPGAGGDCGVDAVIGQSGGVASAVGTYAVTSVSVSLVKSAVVADLFGGTEPVPGAAISYSIAVMVAGSGTARNLVITDPVPDDTTYVPGTLSLNGVSLTDGADGDAGDVGATTVDTITVALGDVEAGAPTQSVSFDVVID
ncbi:MAG: hypothetical protein ABIK85_03530 [Candidatus Eisenbacteria bacterium]